ncbi:hypothetical protein AYO21_05016 [Fonsecaea monophora]|uniref:Uncharacterized protein n=1 Tax=Fonsecaea monophora TaxID=254056 RepID=A0A177F929_9EURO|nr:hypothetical protein AYO21_05016 [Fonsecaea monophora]KAH0837528.1 hypothetical protein FOPE_04959 [Fonsecaea pedrosoi]OAG40718.1 hypothetical protein AYO21_05016 [Fonsecaea monophora]
MYIEEIPSVCIPTFAKLLQFRPNEAPEALSLRIAKGVKLIPSFLRSSRLENILLPPRGHLCQQHKSLHYDAVDVVLHHVQLEVGIRLNNLIAHCNLLSPEQYDRVMRLRALHALWLTPDDYAKTFLVSSQGSKWSYQSDRCRACILSRITCDLEILLDLRWTIRSRTTSTFVAAHGTPRLQSWVQVWIAALAKCVERATGQDIDLDTVMLQNEEQAVALKKTRANIEAVKKEKYKYMKLSRTKSGRTRAKRTGSSRLVPNPPAASEHEASGSANLDGVCDNHAGEGVPGEPNEDDLSGMDAYEALTSTTYLPNQPRPHMKFPFESDISSVSGDPSTKGQSPYGRSSSTTERASHFGVVEDPPSASSQTCKTSTHQEETLEYVPPRSQWKTSRQEEPTRPAANDRVHGLFGSSRDSWETDPVLASASSIYSVATTVSKTQKRHASASSQRTTRVNEDEHEHEHGESHSRSKGCALSGTGHNLPSENPRRCAAQTYIDLVAPSPFTTTSETPSRPKPVPGSRLGQFTPPSSASDLFLRLYDEVSRSAADLGTTTISPRSTPTPVVRQDLSRPSRRLASSTEEILDLYDDTISSTPPDKSPSSSSPDTPPTPSTSAWAATGKKSTPERLSVRVHTSERRNHDRRTLTHATHSTVRVRDSPVSRSSPSRSESKSTSSGRSKHHSQSQSQSQGQSRVSESRDDVQSTWSGAYESEIASRNDLGWYYQGRRR